MDIKALRTTLIAAVLLGLLIAGSARAQPSLRDRQDQGVASLADEVVPLLQYQGRLTDPDTGEPVADGSHTMTFRLYETASGGSELWTETEDISVQNGVFSTLLGDQTPLDQDLFNGRELWLGIKVGADVEATPRQRVLPVAYALSLVPGAEISTTDDQPALAVSSASSRSTLTVTNSAMDGIHASGGGGEWAAGVVGYGNSEAHGMGVQGWSKATSGEGYGVWGWSQTPEGAGVKGVGRGGSHGVYGETDYDADWYEANGVTGYSIYTMTAGVMGESVYGNGVFGLTTDPSTDSSAVVGWNQGEGNGVTGLGDGAHGVYGWTGHSAGGYEYAGVYGRSAHTETFGVLGTSDHGIAVLGRIEEPENTHSATIGQHFGSGPGVAGLSESNFGVCGYSNGRHGVYGETYADGFYEFAGVMGHSNYSHTFGVLGTSTYGIGVEGSVSNPENTNPAVTGWNTGGGPGVDGFSQNDVGVRGDGGTYGGYFVSSSGQALFADGDTELAGNLTVGGNLIGGAHTHTGADIVDGSVSSDDIEDRTETLSFPANALNYEPGTIIQADGAGLLWQQSFRDSASLTVARPPDWDGDSDVEMHLYFFPKSNVSGNVDFFIRPRAYDPGDRFEDASSLNGDSVKVSEATIVHEQTFMIPSERFGLAALWVISIQRQGSQSTYADDVVLMSVALSYNAVR